MDEYLATHLVTTARRALSLNVPTQDVVAYVLEALADLAGDEGFDAQELRILADAAIMVT